VVSFTPRTLYPLGKSPRYPLDRRLDGPQIRSGRVEKRKFLTLPGLELRPLSRPARSQSLYRLRYPGSCTCTVEHNFASGMWTVASIISVRIMSGIAIKVWIICVVHLKITLYIGLSISVPNVSV
jgi:hypothetical protein